MKYIVCRIFGAKYLQYANATECKRIKIKTVDF